MFGRKRIRILEVQVNELHTALSFYADSENWKRRGIHPPGTPVKFEMSPMVKDHGGRARAALMRLRISRMQMPLGLAERFRLRMDRRKSLRDTQAASKALGEATAALINNQLGRPVSVPDPMSSPESRPTGETA
jgi:hypothetical protein